MKQQNARSRQDAPRSLALDTARMRRHAGDASQLLKALANEKRLQILCLLAEGDRSVGDLNALLDLSQSALSQHLAKLRDENIVVTRRDAQTIYYRVADPKAVQLLKTLFELYCRK